MSEEITNINLKEPIALETPQKTLENLKLKGNVSIPSFQKNSINSTIGRIKDTSSKRYSVKKVNDREYNVTRIR